jgi:ABC-type antimicrobial peptide transport system permease subunit
LCDVLLSLPLALFAVVCAIMFVPCCVAAMLGVALRFCNKTKVSLNVFCHCVFLLFRPQAYSTF